MRSLSIGNVRIKFSRIHIKSCIGYLFDFELLKKKKEKKKIIIKKKIQNIKTEKWSNSCIISEKMKTYLSAFILNKHHVTTTFFNDIDLTFDFYIIFYYTCNEVLKQKSIKDKKKNIPMTSSTNHQWMKIEITQDRRDTTLWVFVFILYTFYNNGQYL